MDPSIDEVDANGLIEFGDGFNLCDANLVWDGTIVEEHYEVNLNDVELVLEANDGKDGDEGCSHELTSPNEVAGEKSVMNKPFVDQVFGTWEAAYEFYNNYAYATGFGLQISSTMKSNIMKKVISRQFVCDKEGQKRVKEKRDDVKELRERRLTRMNCKAKMIIKFRDNQWKITTFDDIHSHELTSPLKRQMHHSHSQFRNNKSCKNLIEQLGESNFKPAQIKNAINSTSNAPVVSTNQVIAHLRALRENNMGKEAVTVANHFPKRKSEDPNFYFELELDANDTLRSMFWADLRAREAYLTFSDVIIFDVTYKTNRFKMPFAPFTRVNHHRQSTLFGCALLADEREETFTWLFEQWLTCMFGKAPGAIITDMDGVMRNAIRKVFPQTRHRFCSWHIKKHLLEHVADMRDADSDFYKDYNHWFFRREIENFESEWKTLVDKYDIDESHWLGKMWDLREHWVPAYWRDTFTAGMTYSQRSESINSFFDGYVNQNTSLVEFLGQYDKALVEQRKAESEEDFKSKNTIAKLKITSPLERKAGEFYTKKMFTIFQDEMMGNFALWKDKLGKNGNVVEYSIGIRTNDKKKYFRVLFDSSNDVTVRCQCAKFEREGILCRHIIHVMDRKQVPTIPKRYLLKRWSIDASYRAVGTTSVTQGDTSRVNGLKRWCLMSTWQQLIEKVGNDEILFKKMTDFCTELAVEVEKKEKEIVSPQSDLVIVGSQVQSNIGPSQIPQSNIGPSQIPQSNIGLSQIPQSNIDSSQIPGFTIHDPEVVRTKGRPKRATRHVFGIEATQAQKQQRQCKKCGEYGHYRTSCPKRAKVAGNFNGETKGGEASHLRIHVSGCRLVVAKN
ncbi:protein FAR1-RELATED SEQUENCE 5-like [Tasmannia lanceolata]|uniref:protein FAR1-RELATED SEQUENCE 5-like n=1 Tax=Tasmannia lanceolata TaxID=3420 RepID=UPI0040645E39